MFLKTITGILIITILFITGCSTINRRLAVVEDYKITDQKNIQVVVEAINKNAKEIQSIIQNLEILNCYVQAKCPLCPTQQTYIDCVQEVKRAYIERQHNKATVQDADTGAGGTASESE